MLYIIITKQTYIATLRRKDTSVRDIWYPPYNLLSQGYESVYSELHIHLLKENIRKWYVNPHLLRKRLTS